MKKDLKLRLFQFATDTFIFLKKIPDNQGYQVFKYQLIKSSSSSGANYEEAQGASSRADFNNKVLISLREMRESNFFLRLLMHTYNNAKTESEICRLIKESDELMKILGSIVSRSRKKNS